MAIIYEAIDKQAFFLNIRNRLHEETIRHS